MRTMASPSRFAHYVLRTNRLQELTDWYCTLLDAHVVFTNGKLTFLTYDDEHHRIALVAHEPFAEKGPQPGVGFFHAAFAYDRLGDLLENYQRVKAKGIEPYRFIAHGPTVSFYYRDPELNEVELQVDSFKTAAEADAFMRGEHFARNPIGILLDPQEVIAKYRAGVPEAILLQRPDTL